MESVHSEIQTPPESANFPPFDSTTFESQLVWLALSFGILYYLMSRVTLPRIATVIEERRDRIADDLDQAAQFRKSTDEAISAYDTALEQARTQAQTIATDAQKTLAAEMEAEKHALDQQLERELAESQTRIAQTKQASLAHVRTIATDVAQVLANHLLEEEVDTAHIRAAIDTEQT